MIVVFTHPIAQDELTRWERVAETVVVARDMKQVAHKTVDQLISIAEEHDTQSVFVPSYELAVIHGDKAPDPNITRAAMLADDTLNETDGGGLDGAVWIELERKTMVLRATARVRGRNLSTTMIRAVECALSVSGVHFTSDSQEPYLFHANRKDLRKWLKKNPVVAEELYGHGPTA